MARIRSVHPGLWTDEGFVELSLTARLFFIGLWNEADDFGVFEWKPRRLKMRLAPADPIDPDEILVELAASGFVVRLERGGKSYGAVKNFLDFQRPKNPSNPTVEIDDEVREVVGPHSASHRQGLRNGSGTPTPDVPQSSPSPTPDVPQSSPPPTEDLPKSRGQMEDGGDKMEDGGGSLSKEDSPQRRRKSSEAKASAAQSAAFSAPPNFPDDQDSASEADLFRLGKRVLGDGKGGQVTKLKKRFGVAEAYAYLRRAEGKADPQEWIGALLARDPEEERLRNWGIEPAKPYRPGNGAADSHPAADAGAPDLPGVQPPPEEDEGESPFCDPDPGRAGDPLPPLRSQRGGQV